MEDSIEEKVKEIVAKQLGIDKTEIEPDASFTDDLNADSLDSIEILMELGNEYDLEIPDEDAEKIRTFGAAVDYIKNHHKPK